MTDDRRQRIEQIYLDALDIPAVDRPGFLERACQGDRDLRDEVEALLELQPAADTFLESPAIESAARTLAEILPALRPPEIPGYKIIRHLGEGGMGLVYLAEQQAPLRRLVALKVIRPGMDSRQIVARFNAERQALAQMDHPNIAAVHDAGATSDGRPYFVMEFVDGLPISEYCDRHGLPTAARLELFTQVCAAVQHAHQKGVVHRDLKPSNVLVAEQDGRPVPKVIDFGTAKAIDRSADGGVTLTAHGMVLGTIEYMSPEQAAFSRDIDTTSDVYSLGVMLYELLVGVLPFERPRPGPEGYDELRRLIRESDPPRPSARLSTVAESRAGIASARQTDPGRLSRSLKGDLDWITLKALEKDRTRRYATVAGFAADIRRFLSDQTVDARPPSAAYRIRKFTRRHRGGVAAAVALLLTVTTGITVAVTLYLRAERTLAESEYRNYVMTINLADSEIRASQLAAARARLRSIPSSRRGWEWEHLIRQADASLFTLADDGPCVNPPNGRPLPVGNSLLSDPPAPGSGWQLGIDRLTLGADDSRIYLRHCGRLTHWDTATFSRGWVQGTESWRLVGATASGLGLATSRSGESWNLTLVDLQGTRPARTIGAVGREPICLDMNADGSLLAVGLLPLTGWPSEPDVFEIWNTVTHQRLRRVETSNPGSFGMRDRQETTCAVRLSQDTSLLATSGYSVNVWETDSGRVRRRDPVQAGVLAQPVAFSPDGRQLAVGRRTGQVVLMDLIDVWRPVRELEARPLVERRLYPHLAGDREATREVRAVVFSADGRAIVSAAGNRVTVWDRDGVRLLGILEGHDASVAGLAVRGSLIYSSDMLGQIRAWSIDGPPAVARFGGSSFNPHITVNAAGTDVAGAGLDGAVDVWNLEGHRRVQSGASATSWFETAGRQRMGVARMYPTGGECEPDSPRSLAVSADERYLAYTQGSCIVVQEVARAATLAVLQEDVQPKLNPFVPQLWGTGDMELTFRPDGALRISSVSRYDGGYFPRAGIASVRIWDWRSNRTLELHERPIQFSADPHPDRVSADGQRIAMWDRRAGLVTIWDSTRTREIGRVPVSSFGGTFALSPDGRRVAVASTMNDPSVRIWDVDASQLMLTLTDTDSHSSGMAFTPDGRLIAGRVSGGVTIWETQRPKCQECPKTPTVK